ncbi:hypothetical protein GOP47_0001211 [Adiantum capillus-veneris]|uniref:Uncharacterized protein n=1 Tax=Adiantum capillus-veneris TaxID=13818 RepID=A0A9D4ZTQ2_ADICA|nr:hypothetical protein GOP47_0001211 [Adiantum capillus-veneris]
MLLMDLLIKVAMQASLCRLLQVVFFKDNDVSLAVGGETCDAKAFQSVQVCFGCGDGPCIQPFEGWFYEGLHDWLVDKVTGAKQGILAYVLQTNDDDQSYIFYPGGSFITIGRAYGFPFDQAGAIASESLSIYLLLFI